MTARGILPAAAAVPSPSRATAAAVEPPVPRHGAEALEAVLAGMRACRICRDAPAAAPLPHEPVPVFQIHPAARVAICSQAPGIRAHVAGIPFHDPSGDRLRDWLGLDHAAFYDPTRLAIVPMGFCFPGWDAHGGDLPPRRECRATWHDRLFPLLPNLELVLSVGSHSLRYHVPFRRRQSVSAIVTDWRAVMEESRAGGGRIVIPLPHPSWRNNAWLKRHPWFEAELLPTVRREVAARM